MAPRDAGEHIPESDEYGISSFTFTARRPFHPEKFYEFLHNTEDFWEIIAVEGLFLVGISTRVRRAMEPSGRRSPVWFRWHVLKLFPEENWPTDPDYLASIKKNWVEPFGDMRQELVFIGQNLDEETMTDALDQCLYLTTSC